MKVEKDQEVSDHETKEKKNLSLRKLQAFALNASKKSNKPIRRMAEMKLHQ